MDSYYSVRLADVRKRKIHTGKTGIGKHGGNMHTLTIHLMSLVTWFPAFSCPSPPGVSLMVSKSSNFFSSIPTLPAIFASRSYVLLRVSFTTLISKNSVWRWNRTALNSQNFAGASRRTAAPASWVRVDDGCQGCICWRKTT